MRTLSRCGHTFCGQDPCFYQPLSMRGGEYGNGHTFYPDKNSKCGQPLYVKLRVEFAYQALNT